MTVRTEKSKNHFIFGHARTLSIPSPCPSSARCRCRSFVALLAGTGHRCVSLSLTRVRFESTELARFLSPENARRFNSEEAIGGRKAMMLGPRDGRVLLSSVDPRRVARDEEVNRRELS